MQTIWDAGGANDAFDASSFSGDLTIDLREAVDGNGDWHDYKSIIEDEWVYIARGAVIENAFGANGNDKFTGNDADNFFVGYQGNDEYIGGDHGTRGDSVSYSYLDIAGLNGGTDGVYANLTSGISLVYSADLTTVRTNDSDTFSGIENLIGSKNNDTLIGDGNVNILQGGDGADTLQGMGGADVLTGGAGADTFVIDAGDFITDFEAGDRLAINGRLYYASQAEYQSGDRWTLTSTTDLDGNPASEQKVDINLPGQGSANGTPNFGGAFTIDADRNGSADFSGNASAGAGGFTFERPDQDDDGSAARDQNGNGIDDTIDDGRAAGAQAEAGQLTDPLVLDLDGDGIELTDVLVSPVSFDMTGDGIAEQTGWIGGGDGLLVRDRNANGTIDGIGELYGNDTQSGFSMLRADEASGGDGDGIVETTDGLYGNLRVWQDANHDGISQSSELHTLASLGITAIDARTGSLVTDDRWIGGNRVVETSEYTTGSGTGEIAEVLFRIQDSSVLTKNIYVGSDPTLLALPQSAGYGDLLSWQDAMAADATLKTLIQNFASSTDLSNIQADVTAILYRWAGVDGVGATSRGANMDARQVEFLEKLFDNNFLFTSSTSDEPNAREAALLKQAWEGAFDLFTSRLLVQGPLADLFPNASYNASTDKLTLGSTLEDVMDALDVESYATNINVVLTLRGILIDNATGLDASVNDINLAIGGKLAGILGDSSLEGSIIAAFDAENVVDHATLQPDWYPSGAYVYVGTGKADLILGGAGNDSLEGNGGADLLVGGNGNDYLTNTTDTYYNMGMMTPVVSNGDTLLGGAGNDHFRVYGSEQFISGGDGADSIYAFHSSGGAGYSHSTINGGAGNDSITANGNDHLVYGGDGNDTVASIWGSGSLSRSYIDLGAGNDQYQDQVAGQNTIVGGDGDDKIWVRPDNVIDAGAGNDTISLTNYNGNGTVYGGAGDDLIQNYGYFSSNVEIFDGTGNDTLVGYQGATFFNITQNAGDDDVIDGGLWTNSHQIDLSDFAGIASFDDLVMAQVGSDTVIDLGSGQTLTLKNIALSTVTPHMFRGAASSGTFNGTSGADTIYGSDTTHGGSGIDHLLGGDGNDQLDGSGSNDIVEGGNGNDFVFGGAGSDTLIGGLGNDTFYGGAIAGSNYNYSTNQYEPYGGADSEADVFVITPEASSSDTIGILRPQDGDTIDLRAFTTILSFDDLTIVPGDMFSPAEIHLPDNQKILLQGGFPDNITASTFIFYDPAIYGTSGADALDVSAALAGQIVKALGGADTITGSAHHDTLWGGDGDDFVYAGSGNDLIIGGAGSDYIDGGSDSDTVSYQNSSAWVNVDLANNNHWNGDAAWDNILNVENIIGSAFNDNLTGTIGANALAGGNGNDTMTGLAGADTIDGGAGDDYITAGDDNDLIIGGAGSDYIDGGNGSDTVSYATSSAAVNIDLGGNSHWGGDASWDSILNVENVTGSVFSDNLVGTTTENVLTAGEGNDSIYGMDGNDTIFGGDGNDYIEAGDGDDLIIGGAGSDYIDGGSGSDTVSYATSGIWVNVDLLNNNQWSGDAAWDNITGVENVIGSAYADQITGTSGVNILTGGGGNDTLTGDAGNDVFYFAVDHGQDTITDFQGVGAAAGDMIQIAGSSFGALSFAQNGSDAIITTPTGTITLIGVNSASLTADDFNFA